MPARLPARIAFALALGVVVVAGPGPAAAQSSNPAALAAARELITIKGAKSMFDAVVPGVVETVKNNFLRTNPGLSKDLNEVAAQLHKEFQAQRNQPLEEVAKVFADRFTLQELQGAITFYKTPLGQKLIEGEVRALEDGMQQAEGWANRFADQVLTRMRAEMQKRGHKI
jgi:uncharacterized protein